MSWIVLDCSAVIPWCFEDEVDEASERLLSSLGSWDAMVPALWPLEVANVLSGAERRGRISSADSYRFMQLVRHLPIVVDPETASRATRETLEIARSQRLTSYDASYLELAMRMRAPLATRDGALKDAAVRVGVTLFG